MGANPVELAMAARLYKPTLIVGCFGDGSDILVIEIIFVGFDSSPGTGLENVWRKSLKCRVVASEVPSWR